MEFDFVGQRTASGISLCIDRNAGNGVDSQSGWLHAADCDNNAFWGHGDPVVAVKRQVAAAFGVEAIFRWVKAYFLTSVEMAQIAGEDFALFIFDDCKCPEIIGGIVVDVVGRVAVSE